MVPYLHSDLVFLYIGSKYLGTEQQKDGFIIVEDHKNVKKNAWPPPESVKKMLDPPFWGLKKIVDPPHAHMD